MAGVPRENGVFEARYANHFQVGHNEFEFIFDFGQFHGGEGAPPVESGPVQIARIVMAPPFAQALLNTLQRAIGDHERLHGPIDKR
jgi:hypothetical protein